MAYKIYQILLTHLNYTLCKKLPLAQFSKTIKDGLNPTEKKPHMHKINNSHTLHKRFLFFSSLSKEKWCYYRKVTCTTS